MKYNNIWVIMKLSEEFYDINKLLVLKDDHQVLPLLNLDAIDIYEVFFCETMQNDKLTLYTGRCWQICFI